jgi:hypothetical protein
MKTKKITRLLILSTLLTLAIPLVSAAPSDKAQGKPGHLTDGTYVYVTSQDKYYRTIVPVSPEKGLPWKGPFQLLEMTGPTGLQTEFGPGDHGYVGGRWWLDANHNGYEDADDVYFLCPLLGPAIPYDELPQ